MSLATRWRRPWFISNAIKCGPQWTRSLTLRTPTRLSVTARKTSSSTHVLSICFLKIMRCLKRSPSEDRWRYIPFLLSHCIPVLNLSPLLMYYRVLSFQAIDPSLDILRFFTELPHSGLDFSELNSAAAAISSIVPGSGNSLGVSGMLFRSVCPG